ncbi:MAG: nuclear transport factor 2 family protein [Chromatiales bacterium]|nr:nuclear transport factor 2 family protein [Chromatiales bacterium]
MSNEEMMELIKQFRTAFRAADRVGLSDVLTEDFEWHMHYANRSQDRPTGRIAYGVDGMMEVLEWRKQHWSNQRSYDLVERPAGDVILQMFTTIGSDDVSGDFHWNVVDVYPVRDGRIAKKDTYWKHAK